MSWQIGQRVRWASLAGVRFSRTAFALAAYPLHFLMRVYLQIGTCRQRG
jgi:hypothetical protein